MKIRCTVASVPSARAFYSDPDVWDSIYGASDVNSVVHQERLRRALLWVDELQVPSWAGVALDAGCGAGQSSTALAERGIPVVAADRQPEMLRRTVRRAAEHDVPARVQPVRADAAALPFSDRAFQLVVALGLLPWVASPSLVMDELTRTLAPTGLLVLGLSNRRRLSWLLDPVHSPVTRGPRWLAGVALRGRVSQRPWRGPVAHVHTMAALRALLDSHGLALLGYQAVGFGPFTLFGRRCLPDRLGLRLNRALQALADRHVPGLRYAGAQHLVIVGHIAEPAPLGLALAARPAVTPAERDT